MSSARSPFRRKSSQIREISKFKRGEEKGYFLPGGSTIIIVAKNIKVDKDILKYSKLGIETLVEVGEKVGE